MESEGESTDTEDSEDDSESDNTDLDSRATSISDENEGNTIRITSELILYIIEMYDTYSIVRPYVSTILSVFPPGSVVTFFNDRVFLVEYLLCNFL